MNGPSQFTPSISAPSQARLSSAFSRQASNDASICGSGTVMVGEVSQCNDDTSDNRFFEPVGRFPEIDEDEAPLHLLCSDYDKFLA